MVIFGKSLYITRISSCILPFNKSSLVRFTSLVLRHEELVRRPEAAFVFSLSNHGHLGLFSDLSGATALSSNYLGQSGSIIGCLGVIIIDTK